MHVHNIQIQEKTQVYSYDKIQNVQITEAHNLVIVSLPSTQSTVCMYVRM